MIEATVLLKDGEKVSFTASDMIQAAVFVERQYYPYEKVDIVRVETPAQQDEAKGALPPAAQKQAREYTSNVAPDGRIKGAKPPGAENPSNVASDGRMKGGEAPHE